MFYSQFILAKKGPLGTIWIAAHLERKLRKNQVADTDIGVSVDSILFPEVPIALRLSSHLLLGVVRIYSRKVNYLFDDCSEALLKIKQAFRSTAVDLPPEESTAPYHSITLPETFDLDDFELPDSDIFQGNYVDHHVSTREQITLQDTMEGVVYSTTQFGLDERFGDGDTSGLDLDEELFLNKISSSGQAEIMLASDSEPHPSLQPETPFEEGKNYDGINVNSEAMVARGGVNQLEGLLGNADFVGYAQAPDTPGLVEESSLSKTQEASVCEDHLEIVEDPNLSSIKETSAYDDNAESDHNITNVLDKDKEDLENITINSHNLNDQEIDKLNSRGGLASTARNPLMDESSKATSSTAEYPDRNFTSLDDASGLENLQNVVVGNSEPGHATGEANATCMTCQPVPECVSEIKKASLVPEDMNTVENAGNMEKSCLCTKPVELNTEPYDGQEIGNMESEGCGNPKDSKIFNIPEQLGDAETHIILPCSLMNQSSYVSSGSNVTVIPHSPSGFDGPYLAETSGRNEVAHSPGVSSEVQVGEGGHATDTLNLVMEENLPIELAPCDDIQADFNKVDKQVDNVISRDTRLENVDGSENTELPAPEKLLSVPEGLAHQHDNLLVESTPDMTTLVTDDGGDAGNNIISGKKRSFTESTLTVQSLNSDDSSGLVSSKRAKEFIPDDNDLLSSILVGRRSSVLKMKSTPLPLPEITNMNRHRSAPRVSTSKRKVLVDDTMVLHGDIIRQQLTSTEDIRRIRKKAPCTRSEIWLIHKRLSEDEIFSESIFTGLSTGLDLLHSQTYDLSKIRLSTIDVHNASEEAKEDLNVIMPSGASNDVAEPLEPNDNKETGIRGTGESIVFTNSMEADLVNQHDDGHVFQSHDCDVQEQLETASCLQSTQSFQHEYSKDIIETGIDGASVADAVNSITTLGIEAMPSTTPSLDDKYDMAAGALVPSAFLDEENGGNGFMQVDASGITLDQTLNVQSAEMEVSLTDTHIKKGVDATEVAEGNNGYVALGTMELTSRDDIFLEETEVGGASVNVGIDIDTAYPSHNIDPIPALEIPDGTDGSNSQEVVTIDQSMNEMRKNGLGVANEVGSHAAEFDYDGKELAPFDCCEEPKVGSSYPMQCDIEVKNACLDNGEYTESWETDPQCRMDSKVAANHTATEDHDWGYMIDGHDTGFLNDDDEVAEEDEDCMPSAENAAFLENSGWSARTRAVAKYLQVLFEKEAEHGRRVLPMDNLLVGKTRKEASRMFFEALVLKTKDYIHVEQGTPFDNINIKPGARLMKSDF
ncbi:hypothetical protein NMG60_11031172 [Bertholletia excelsa]